MKTLFLFILLLPLISFAGNGPNSDAYMLSVLRWAAKYEVGIDYQQYQYYGAKPEIMRQNKVGTVKSFNVSKHGKKKEWYTRTYNSFGRLTQMKTAYGTVNYTYKDTLLSEIQHTSKKHSFRTIITYDSQSRIVKLQSSKDNKPTSETVYAYFNREQTSLVERKVFGKKEKIYRLETDYDQVLKKATESRYTINGELQKRWTYSCDEKGKIQEGKVDEVTQCHYYSSNKDGSYISYTRTIEDGKDYLQENTFTKDSVMTEYKRFLHDSILVSHNTYSTNKDVFEGYRKNGKRNYKSIQEKDPNGNIIRRSDYYKSTDKSVIITSFLYSEKNMIQEVTYKDGSKVQFEYTYL